MFSVNSLTNASVLGVVTLVTVGAFSTVGELLGVATVTLSVVTLESRSGDVYPSTTVAAPFPDPAVYVGDAAKVPTPADTETIASDVGWGTWSVLSPPVRLSTEIVSAVCSSASMVLFVIVTTEGWR